MQARTVSLRAALAMVAVGMVGVVVGSRFATADPGARTRDALTVAGTLTGVPTSPPPSLTFTLHKSGAADCPRVARSVVYNGSAFSAELPLDGCGQAYFDGSNVTVDIAVNGTTVLTGGAVNPVPYARYADQVGFSECPVGFERSDAAGITLCTRAITLGSTVLRDEVVLVGGGPSAFWVDRYEASVWALDGMQRGVTEDRLAALPETGQWMPGQRDILRAYSHAGVTPSRRINWFQAMALCRASGKRLIGRSEWFAAADGLTALDPTAPVDGNTAGENRCHTAGSELRVTGRGTGCASSWGAQDMIGNVSEWTDEWFTSVGAVTPTPPSTGPTVVTGVRVNTMLLGWPAGFGGDGTGNVSATVYSAADNTIGTPAAAVRGGAFGSSGQAGVFSFDVNNAPVNRSPVIGFRCVIPR